ncbi:hypothetical protein ABFX02_02G032000 [Erythranthe guttata]
MAAPQTANEVLHDFFPLMREYKDGRVKRYWATELVPPSLDAETLTQSKDVVISPETDLSARIFLPRNADPANKLPLLVYFHGGGFVVESAFSPLYHNHLNLLAAEANVVAVSVNYRLAPEYPLPAAYEDAWHVLKWIASQSINDEWIGKYADLNRVYLGGDSAGGNIASNLAVRFGGEGKEKLPEINLVGVFLNCPFFCSVDPLENEDKHEVFPKVYLDKIWKYACPDTAGSDDPRINPDKDPNLWRFGCTRVLVYAAEKDVLKGRGWLFKETMMKRGWNGSIEVVEVEGEDHIFSVLFPKSENSMAMLKKLASFINNE